MSQAFTKPLSATSTPQTLYALMIAAGYTGPTKFTGELTIVNLNSVPVYVHFTNSGSAAPTGTDGLPIGSDSTTAAGSSFSTMKPDLATAWVYAASSTTFTLSTT